MESEHDRRPRVPAYRVAAAFGAVAVLALGTCAARSDRGARPGAPSVGFPFARGLLAPDRRVELAGTVLERLDAGSYRYLRIASPGAAPEWVVTVGSSARVGEVTRVQVFARVAHFESARLRRTFETLSFGLERSTEPPAR